jgi:hypothetical protein
VWRLLGLAPRGCAYVRAMEQQLGGLISTIGSICWRPAVRHRSSNPRAANRTRLAGRRLAAPPRRGRCARRALGGVQRAAGLPASHRTGDRWSSRCRFAWDERRQRRLALARGSSLRAPSSGPYPSKGGRALPEPAAEYRALPAARPRRPPGGSCYGNAQASSRVARRARYRPARRQTETTVHSRGEGTAELPPAAPAQRIGSPSG